MWSQAVVLANIETKCMGRPCINDCHVYLFEYNIFFLIPRCFMCSLQPHLPNPCLHHPSTLTHQNRLRIHVQAIPNVTGHVSRHRGALQLFVRNSADRTVTLHVLASWSITSVLSKALIRFKGWAGQHRHGLLFGGTPLESERRLWEYGIFDHTTLQLMSLLCGGMDNATVNPVGQISPQACIVRLNRIHPQNQIPDLA